MLRDTESPDSHPIWVENVQAPTLPPTADVVVVGGGVTGLLTAIELRAQGRHVVVLEARNVGNAQSGRNLGFVRQQGREAVETMAMRHANRRWLELDRTAGAEVGFAQGGHLSIARDDEALERIAEWGDLARDGQVPFEILRGQDLEDRYPWLRPGLAGAGLTPGDGHVDPRRAIRAIERLARRAGVEIFEGVTVESVTTQAGRATGVTVLGRTLAASLVVVAAGAWSARILRDAGIRLPLHAGRATVGLTTPAPLITRSSVWEVGGVGFRQSSDGRVVFGLGAFVDIDVRWEDVASSISLLPMLASNLKTMRPHIGRDLLGDLRAVATRRPLAPLSRSEARPNPKFVAEAFSQLQSLVPQLAGVSVETSWAGLMDSTPDFLPIAGECGVADLLVIVGTSGHGMGIAPALADGVAALAAGAEVPEWFSGFSLEGRNR